jgi:hypothetical protein
MSRLIAAHGTHAKLTDLLLTLANCGKARSFSVHDRCKAKYESPRTNLTAPICALCSLANIADRAGV